MAGAAALTPITNRFPDKTPDVICAQFSPAGFTAPAFDNLWGWSADTQFLLRIRPDRRYLPVDAVGRT